MHIIIGFITAIAGLLWALNSLQRSGLDINDFNPFLWARRRKWRETYGQNPLYSLDDARDAAAALIVGIVQLEGEISREQKVAIITMFEHDLKLEPNKAKELFASSAYLCKDEHNIADSVRKILEKSQPNFTDAQKDSLITLLTRAALLEGNLSEQQKQLIKNAKNVFKIQY